MLEWQRWTLRESGRAGWRRAAAILLIVAVVAVVLAQSLPPATAIVLSIILLMSLLPYFLPQHFCVAEEGVTRVRGFGLFNEQHHWAEFRGYQTVAQGYVLVGRRRLYLPEPLEPALAQTLRAFLAKYSVQIVE